MLGLSLSSISLGLGSAGISGAPLVRIADFDLTASPASVVEADVTGYTLINVLFSNVAHTALIRRCIQVSTDGGSTWVNGAGAYSRHDINGVVTGDRSVRMHFTNATAGRSGGCTIYQPGGGLSHQIYSQSIGELVTVAATTSAINRVRMFGGSEGLADPNAGTMTSGRIQVFGQRI